MVSWNRCKQVTRMPSWRNIYEPSSVSVGLLELLSVFSNHKIGFATAVLVSIQCVHLLFNELKEMVSVHHIFEPELPNILVGGEQLSHGEGFQYLEWSCI